MLFLNVRACIAVFQCCPGEINRHLLCRASAATRNVDASGARDSICERLLYLFQVDLSVLDRFRRPCRFRSDVPLEAKAKEKLSREEDEVLIDRRLQIQPRARQKTRELSGERALLFGKHGCSRR